MNENIPKELEFLYIKVVASLDLCCGKIIVDISFKTEIVKKTVSPLVPVSISTFINTIILELTFQKQDSSTGFLQRKPWIGKRECNVLILANLLSYMCWPIAIEFATEERVQFYFPRLFP
jgi:hypothetical protein